MGANDDHTDLVGTVLAGKYRVERVIGSGGMGHVVEATHLELDERVALKFLNAEGMNDPETLARFRREAKLASKIKSEHVAKVTDVGRLDDGTPYIVMELLKGQDLSQMLRRRRLFPVPEAVDYLLQAMGAVAEAHSIGIVHRDLKPQNLFLTKRKDGSDCVKVLDFGISKLMPSSEVEAEASLTHTANTLGSPLYMSPEQMTNPKAVDARADIWALGATLYRLVTGKPPFNGESVAQVCGMILIGNPPPPVSQFAPEAPPAIYEIILRCLQKDPNQRFANLGDFAAALVPFGTHAGAGYAETVMRVLQSAGFAANVVVPQVVESAAGQTAPSSGGGEPAAPWKNASSSWPTVGSPSSRNGASQSPVVAVTSGGANVASMTPPAPLDNAWGTGAASRSYVNPAEMTNNGWAHGAPPSPAAQRKRTILLVLGALAMLGLGAVFAGLMGGGGSGAAAPASTQEASVSPVPLPGPSALSPVVTPSATALPSGSTSATVAPADAPTAPPTTKVRGPLKGVPTGPAKPTQGGDLFDDRR